MKKKLTDKLLVWVAVNTVTEEVEMGSLRQPTEIRVDLNAPWEWKQFRLIPSAPAKALPPPTDQMLWHLREAVGRGRRISPMIFEKHRRGLLKRGLIDTEGYPTESGRTYIQNHPLDGL